MHEGEWETLDDELAELAEMGLIEVSPDLRYSLAPEGERALREAEDDVQNDTSAYDGGPFWDMIEARIN
jgi:hypothetical protein